MGSYLFMKDWVVNQWHESEHTIRGERKKVCQSHILFFGKLFKLGQHRLWQIVYRASCTQIKNGRNKTVIADVDVALTHHRASSWSCHASDSTWWRRSCNRSPRLRCQCSALHAFLSSAREVKLYQTVWIKRKRKDRHLPFNISLPGVGKILYSCNISQHWWLL